MNEKILNEVIVVKNENLVVNQEKLNDVLLDLFTVKENLDEFEKKLREKILESMLKNGEPKYEMKNYTISLVMGKATEKFDKEKFLMNENGDDIAIFININSTETFDIEKFKKENPELYKKYTTVNEDFEVDTNKLSKLRPDLYQKYVTILASTKKPTIAIKESKESKKK